MIRHGTMVMSATACMYGRFGYQAIAHDRVGGGGARGARGALSSRRDKRTTNKVIHVGCIFRLLRLVGSRKWRGGKGCAENETATQRSKSRAEYIGAPTSFIA